MIPRHLSRLGLVFLLPLVTGGCSLLFVKGPPVGHQDMDHFQCTENTPFPLLDAIMAGLQAVATLGAIVEVADEQTVGGGHMIVIGVGGTVLWGASAMAGFKKEGECRAALRELRARKEAAGGVLEGLQESAAAAPSDTSGVHRVAKKREPIS